MHLRQPPCRRLKPQSQLQLKLAKALQKLKAQAASLVG
jgi:hypothetical protein